MSRRLWSLPLYLVCLSLLLLAPVSANPSRPADDWTTLTVGADQVRIYRDAFGVPHIFASTGQGLFEAYGWVVAQDRLSQLEMNRRAARGKLAEVFGANYVDADRFARITGYTDAELDAQFTRLSAEEQGIMTAYVAGINRYVTEVVTPDLANYLPYEFHLAGGQPPTPWTVRDSVAFGAFMVRRFGERGGDELDNLALLNSLISTHGQAVGLGIFNDLRWINDPETPVTILPDLAKRTVVAAPSLVPAQLTAGADNDWSRLEAAARAAWESLGVPTKLGSYGWVVAPGQTTEGAAMLYGGPQMGFSAPEVLHEVQLNGAGWNVMGMAFAGVPPVLIGRNEHIAWTSTTATGDNVDTYAETLCDAGTGAGSGYQYNGACRAYEVRTETINVRGGSPVTQTVQRSVHGPVVTVSEGTAFSQKRAHWGREIEALSAFFTFDRARTVEEFESNIDKIITSHNFFYADRAGHIAYWQAGKPPVRPDGTDPRLPLPGNGTAEWPGGVWPMPRVVNPSEGYIANWNNKPSVDYPNPDDEFQGKQHRQWDLVQAIETRLPLSLQDMRDIPKDIARVKVLGREARFLKPYLLDALQAVPPSHPVAPAARAVLEAWDGNAIANAVTSTTLQPGEILFQAWLNAMLQSIFADELGQNVGSANVNTLLHVLDQAVTGESGVPPSRDYLNGQSANAVMSAAFDNAVAALAQAQGNTPSAWTAPRGTTNFNHPVIGNVGSIPLSNRSTYGQIVVLRRPYAYAENIFTLGQSGFIKLVPPFGYQLDPHFRDQLDLYRNFEYKPMRLYLSPALNEVAAQLFMPLVRKAGQQ